LLIPTRDVVPRQEKRERERELTIVVTYSGESIPIRLFLTPFELTPTYRNVHSKFSLKYYLNLVLVDEEDRRYFKQQVQSLLCPQLVSRFRSDQLDDDHSPRRRRGGAPCA
jgi:hypothetical protein